MPASAYLPPPPVVPVSQLPRDQVRSLAHVYGHHKRHAQYRFCALLPIVVRDKIYLDDGCHDQYEWAAKFGAMSNAEVDRVLTLWATIGDYDCLWRLLGDGVGISKLERVAPHVTPDNAVWMAKRVQHLTKPELEELLRSSRRPRSAGRKVGSATEATSGEHGAKSEAAKPAKGSGTADQAPNGSGAFSDPGVPGDTETHGVVEVLGVVEVPAGSDTYGDSDTHGDSEMTCGDSEAAGYSEAPNVASVGDPEPVVGFVSGFVPEAADPPGDALVSPKEAGAVAEPVPRMCRNRLTLEVDPIGEKRIRELQTMYERLHGRPIGIGQLVSLLARWAVIRGELPSLEDLAEGKVSESVSDDRAGVGTEVAGAGEGRFDSPAAPTKGPGAKRFQPRLVEVVVSIAETGWKYIRTALGWVPVSDGAVAGFLSKGQPVPLENLRIAAIAASREVSGKRYRPAAVDRYLLARSGGYCEVNGCNRRAVAAHHSKRFAFDPSHHPDDLVCACPEHHGLAHKGLVRDESQDPLIWELLREGEFPELNSADLMYQTYSAIS